MCADTTLQTAERLQSSGPERDQKLHVVKHVKAAVDAKMVYLFDGLMLNVVDALFEEMHGCDEQDLLKTQFNISRQLKISAAPYRAEYTLLMNLSWVSLVKGRNCAGIYAIRSG